MNMVVSGYLPDSTLAKRDFSLNFNRLFEDYQQALGWVDDPQRAVHLLGIGGVGMAGLALILYARGIPVSGCDLNTNALTQMLRDRGIDVSCGHDPEHITPAIHWAIRSAAVPEDHPEAMRVHEAGIPLFRRGVVLPALLRARRSITVAGTHGKTTTTGFVAQLFHAVGRPVGFCIGGEIPALGNRPAAEGEDAVMVAEADESDGTLALYETDTAVVTNVDFDHMENFADHEEFEACFRHFIERTRRCLIYNRDDPAATRLAAERSNTVSFGFHHEADYQAVITETGPGRIRFAVAVRGQSVGEINLPAPGNHNVLNAMAALAAVVENGVPIEIALTGFESLDRPRRRFETIALHDGCRIVSDYAHHPTEIRALLQTALREQPVRLLTVFQPHRYTRTRALGDAFPEAFEGADPLVLLPVYAASESPLAGGSAADLYARFRKRLQRRILLAESLDQATRWLEAEARHGDLILIVGAGSVEKVGLDLAQRWQRRLVPNSDFTVDRRRRLLTETGLPADRVIGSWPLAPRTTLGVGGAADLAVRVVSEQELAAVLAWTAANDSPVHILGGGSNLLVSDLGVRGVVIRLMGAEFRSVSVQKDGSVLAGAAAPLARLAALSRSGQVAGFGFLTGIPGTVGGAIRGNAGAWGSTIGDRVVRVCGIDNNGRHWTLDRDRLDFTYRDCATLHTQGAITGAWLQPQPSSPADTRESDLMTEYEGRRAWMRGKRTAGSVFRNPEHAFAGALLDAAGCKDMRIGGARVCAEHANVIACEPSACASDVLALMQSMQARVQHHGDVELIPEIIRWI